MCNTVLDLIRVGIVEFPATHPFGPLMQHQKGATNIIERIRFFNVSYPHFAGVNVGVAVDIEHLKHFEFGESTVKMLTGSFGKLHSILH